MFAGLTCSSSEVYRIYNRSAFLNDSSFRPITELTLDDSDTALVFLSANRVIYTQPVEDDWYAAHQKINDTLHGSFLGPNDIESLPIYLADEPTSVLGCKMSYQTCDPALSPEKGCTPPSGRHDIDFSITQPRTRRDKILRWFWSATGFDINLVIVTLKASSLTSRFRLYNQFQGSIPVNQWQQEVENWHNITLALFQGLIVDAATGSENPEMLQYFWTPPNNTEERYLCQNQVRLLLFKEIQSLDRAATQNLACIWVLGYASHQLSSTDRLTENHLYCLRKFLPALARCFTCNRPDHCPP